MEDLKLIYEILEKIQTGQWSIPLIMVVLAGVIIFYYFRRKAESIAQLSAGKALEKFKIDLSNGKDFLFRDEKIRVELLSYVGKLSIDKKIECWQETSSSYFLYQTSWNFSQDTNLDSYQKIDSVLNNVREKIFENTVYLGYDLSNEMVHLNSLMREGLRHRRTGHGRDVENEISETKNHIEKRLIDILHSADNIEKYDFTEEQKNKLEELEKKQFDNIE